MIQTEIDTEAGSSIARVRIKITQQAKKEVCEFTVEVALGTSDEQMHELEQICWCSADRMIVERNKRGFVTDV